MDNSSKHGSSAHPTRLASRRKFLTAAGVGSVVSLAGCVGGLSGSGGTTTLRVLNSSYEPVQKEFQKLFKEFEEQEGDVKIEYNRVGFAEAPQKASQAHAADKPYDIMNLASPGNNVTAAKKGILQPINSVIEDRGGSDYWIDKALFKLDGDHYFAPHYGSVLNMLYREDLFKQAGAPLPPFDNWSQYQEAAKVLTKANDNQYGHPVFLGNNHFHGVWPMMLVLGNGGHLVNSDGKIVYDSQKTADALAFIKEMDQYSPESAHNSSIPNMRPPLYKGQYAMTWYSTNLMPSDIEKYNPDLKGKVHVTHVPASTKEKTPVARMTGTGYGMSSKTENPEKAKKLIKYITKRENVTRLLLAQPAAKVPMVKGMLDQDKLWESETLSEYEDHYRNLVGIAQDYGRIIAVNENPDTVDATTGRALSEAHVVKSVQDVVLNDMDPMQSAKKWANKMREDLE
jgi:ABC-type glycerol-3-phosphate transport system substrate-binding protein